jgi:hypothetical protein
MHNKKKRSGSGSGGGGFASAAMQSLATKTFPYAGPLRPGKQSPQRVVIEENVLVKPDYWQTGTPSRASKPLLPWMIEVKSVDEIAKMRRSGVLARHVLDMAGRMVRAGITTDAIDARVHEEIIAVRGNAVILESKCCVAESARVHVCDLQQRVSWKQNHPNRRRLNRSWVHLELVGVVDSFAKTQRLDLVCACTFRAAYWNTRALVVTPEWSVSIPAQLSRLSQIVLHVRQ